VGTNGRRQGPGSPGDATPVSHFSESRQAMSAAPGMPGAAPSDPGHDGEAAGDGCTDIMPTARWPRSGPGDRQMPGRVSYPRPDPVAGISRDTVRASGGCGTTLGPGSEASGRRPPAAPDVGGTFGQVSGHTPQSAMTLMRPPRTRARAAADSPRCPAGNSQRRAPWPPGTGATLRVGPVSGKDCHRPGGTTGTDRGRGRTALLPVPRLPTLSRLTGPKDRSYPRATAGAVTAGCSPMHVERVGHFRTLWQALAWRSSGGN
jgi:hypothetical protein